MISVVKSSADLRPAPGEGLRGGLEADPTFLQWLQHQNMRTEACRRGESSPEDPEPHQSGPPLSSLTLYLLPQLQPNC